MDDALDALKNYNSNIELRFARGQTFTFSVVDTHTQNGHIGLSGYSNVLVGSYLLSGDPSESPKPVLDFFGSATKTLENSDAVETSSTSHNIVIQDLQFTSQYIDTTVKDAPDVVNEAGANIVVRDCDLGTVDASGNTTGEMEGIAVHAGSGHGLLIQDNQDIAPLQSYGVYTAGSPFTPQDIVVLENTILKGSQAESDVRITEPTLFANVDKNTLHTEHKSALRLMGAGYLWAEGNDLSGQGNWLGPLPDSALPSNPRQNGNSDDTTNYAVVDGNTFGQPNDSSRNFLRLNPGLRNAVVRNNIFWGNANIYVRGEANREAKNVVNNVWVVNNTRLNATNYSFVQFELDCRDLTTDNKCISYDPYIRLLNFHLANNLAARPHGNAAAPLMTDGISFAALKNPTPSTAYKWSDEVIGGLVELDYPPAADTRWWAQDNVWTPSPSFILDGAAMNIDAWNDLFSYGSDRWIPRGGVKVAQDTLAPDPDVANVGLRDVFADPTNPTDALEVAAWDIHGNLRPLTGLTAGAVELNPLGNWE